MAAPLPHVLLVPGFAGGSTLFLNFRDALRAWGLQADGWQAAPFVYRKPIAWYGERLAHDILTHEADELVLVGWSMGGLVGVEAMRDEDAAAKVRRVIAYATPFDGTWAAGAGRLVDPLLRFHVRQMAKDSETLRALVGFLRQPRAWDFRAVNGTRDWLAKGPLKSLDPAWCQTGDFDHRSLLWNPVLFELIHRLILMP